MNNTGTTCKFYPSELAMWATGEWTIQPDLRIDHVSNDSRTIAPGSLYFAISGDNFDGHDFVQKAFDNGAVGAVVSDDWFRESGAHICENRSVLVVANTRKALGHIASGYRIKVDPVTIGVTGSMGKSTVKEMTAQILSLSIATASTKGNWNNDIGLPLSLLGMELSTSVGVFEVGTNHTGEVAALCDLLKPSWGVVTNIAPAHIGNFGSLDTIAEEKGRLLSSLPDDGVAFLPSDCEYLSLLKSKCSCRIVLVGFGEKDDYIIHHDEQAAVFVVVERATGDEFIIDTPVRCCGIMQNAAFAVAVARTYGVMREDIENALSDYIGLPMRWEETFVGWNKFGKAKTTEDGFVKIINDAYNANPLSMRAAITAFANNEKSTKWLVLGDMLELGASEHDEHIALGEFVAEIVSTNSEFWGGLIVVGEGGQLIAQGAEGVGCGCVILRCGNDADVIAVLTERISVSDVVLLKASRKLRFENIVNSMEE